MVSDVEPGDGKQKAKISIWKRLLVDIVVFVVLLSIAMAFAIVFSDKLIFHPQPVRPDQKKNMTMLEVAPGTNIALRYLPCKKSKYTILFSHGNTEDLVRQRRMIAEYPQKGYAVVAYDYEGFGFSDGSPTEQSCYRDIDAVYKYMTETLKIPPERIIIYGRSVGSGPSCYLAEKEKAAGLILEGGFMSPFRVVVPFPLPFDKFRNIDRIANVNMPKLFFHGVRDGVVPYKHGRALYEKASEPKTFIKFSNGNHNNLRDYKLYWESLHKFVDSLDSGRS